MSPFSYVPDESEIKLEKNKAKALKASQWWKRRCAKGICYYCGKKFAAKKLTMDHIVPISKGGKSTKGNLVPCCKDCNTKKKANLLMEWDGYMDRENQ